MALPGTGTLLVGEGRNPAAIRRAGSETLLPHLVGETTGHPAPSKSTVGRTRNAWAILRTPQMKLASLLFLSCGSARLPLIPLCRAALAVRH